METITLDEALTPKSSRYKFLVVGVFLSSILAIVVIVLGHIILPSVPSRPTTLCLESSSWSQSNQLALLGYQHGCDADPALWVENESGHIEQRIALPAGARVDQTVWLGTHIAATYVLNGEPGVTIFSGSQSVTIRGGKAGKSIAWNLVARSAQVVTVPLAYQWRNGVLYPASVTPDVFERPGMFYATDSGYNWSTRYTAISPDGNIIISPILAQAPLTPMNPGLAAILKATSPSYAEILTPIAWNPAKTAIARLDTQSLAIFDCATGKRLFEQNIPSQPPTYTGSLLLIQWSPDGHTILLTNGAVIHIRL